MVGLPRPAAPFGHKITVGRILWGCLPITHLSGTICYACGERLGPLAYHMVWVVRPFPFRAMFHDIRGKSLSPVIMGFLHYPVAAVEFHAVRQNRLVCLEKGTAPPRDLGIVWA